MKSYPAIHVEPSDEIKMRDNCVIMIGLAMVLFESPEEVDRLRQALNPVTPEDRMEKLRGESADEERCEACSHCEEVTLASELDDIGECIDCRQRPEREEARREARADCARSEEG